MVMTPFGAIDIPFIQNPFENHNQGAVPVLQKNWAGFAVTPQSQYQLGLGPNPNPGPTNPGTDNSAINNGGGGSSGSGGGGGGASYNPADIAYLDDQSNQLSRQKQSAEVALNNGLVQLGDSYNQEVNKANTNQSRALQDLSLKREDTTRGKDQALGRVDTNARTLANSLRARIGLESGANSSAYKLAAPSAVARDASTQRTGVQESYGTNFRNLDVADQRTKDDYASMLQDLLAQKNQRESGFRQGILGQENQIDQSLSGIAAQRAQALGGGAGDVRSAIAPFSGAIAGRQAAIDNLFSQFRTPFNVAPVTDHTPQLQDYTTQHAQIAANSPDSAGDPFSQALKKKLDQTA